MSIVKWLKGIIPIGVVLLFTPPIFGQEVMTVTLDVIEMIHAQEKGGDELYFSITEFPTKSSPQHYQIPSYPSHWLSRYIDKVKDVQLWKKDIGVCEDVDVVISLVEEDLTPWVVNDLLGSIEFKVRCENGKLKTQWAIPDQKNTAKILNEENAFSFTGKHSEYHAKFKLEKKIDARSLPEKEKAKSSPNIIPNLEYIR